MRNGILLAEDSPDNIMKAFNTSSLEDAFLILSQKQGQSEEADNTLLKMITNDTPPTSSAASTSGTIAPSSSEKSPSSATTTIPSPSAAAAAAVALPVSAVSSDLTHSMPKMDVEYLAGQDRYLRRNKSFAEQKPPGFLSKLQFTSTTRMKALLTKNVLQLVRQMM